MSGFLKTLKNSDFQGIHFILSLHFSFLFMHKLSFLCVQEMIRNEKKNKNKNKNSKWVEVDKVSFE